MGKLNGFIMASSVDHSSDLVSFVVNGDFEDVELGVFGRVLLASQHMSTCVAFGSEHQDIAGDVSFGAAVAGAAENSHQASRKIAPKASLLAVPVLVTANYHCKLVCLLSKT